jgi:hypothetical protein
MSEQGKSALTARHGVCQVVENTVGVWGWRVAGGAVGLREWFPRDRRMPRTDGQGLQAFE